MTAMITVGAATGAALFGLLWTLVPHRPSLLRQLARYDARPGAGADLDRPGPGARARHQLGSASVRWLAQRGIAYRSLRQDLALSGRTLETVMPTKVLAFIGGFVLVLAAAATGQETTGLRWPIASPALLALAIGALAFVVPDVRARRQATLRRTQFRRALSSWLDLVALEMAGSAAPAEALPAAARVATGWPMIVLGDTLYRATAARQDHWDALTDLGQRIGVPELVDLAALTRQVGRDGARVRDTLTARAASLRRALLADIEIQAGRRDQSMILAQLLIGTGFIAWLMYAGLVNVLAS
jgi:Flp pilus assembly protein TadB